MPNKRATKDITDVWRARIKKIDRRGEIAADSIFDNILSDENNSSDSPAPDSDSTYNLEDDITPPVITPLQLSEYGSDESENLQEEMDPAEYIIPPYLYHLPSVTRSLNIEFNRCLLLDIEPLPSTSFGALNGNNFYYPSNPLNSAKSSSSSESVNSDSNKYIKRRVTFNLTEHIEELENEDSISTDGEVKTNYSPKSHVSSSLVSYDTEEIIPKYFFVKSKSNEDDSKATDVDVCEMPDMYASVSCGSLDPIAEIETDEIKTKNSDETEENELHLEYMYSSSLESEYINIIHENDMTKLPLDDSMTNEYNYKNNSPNEPIDDYNNSYNVIYLPNFEYEWNEALIEKFGNSSEPSLDNSSENESNDENDQYDAKDVEYEKYSNEAFQ